eukprot:SAG31_NODE_2830_length_5027_cov_3.418425_6_plen_169_part_00
MLAPGLCEDPRAYATAAAQRVPSGFIDRAMRLAEAAEGTATHPVARDENQNVLVTRSSGDAIPTTEDTHSAKYYSDAKLDQTTPVSVESFSADETVTRADEDRQEYENGACVRTAQSSTQDPIDIALSVCAPGTRCELMIDFNAGDLPPPWVARGQAVVYVVLVRSLL